VATTPTLRLTSPAELLRAIPYLLGFVPEQSIVAVGVREGTASARLDLTLRADLPPPSDAPACAEVIAGHLVQAGAAAAVYVIYPDVGEAEGGCGGSAAPPLSGYLALADVLGRSAHLAGVAVWDILLVTNGNWRSLQCTDDACCPPAGNPLDIGAPTAVEATAVAAGLSALPSRDALVATLRPADSAAIAAVRAELSRLTARRLSTSPGAVASRRSTTVRLVERLTAARSTAIEPPAGGALNARQVARILVGLGDPRAVDRCCRWAPGPPCDAAIALWSELVRLSPPPHAAAPASILSYLAWRQGLGALANIAVQRALADDPGHTFANLMDDVLGCGVDPRHAAAGG
jgi:Domain of unknown function (DUF4192)